MDDGSESLQPYERTLSPKPALSSSTSRTNIRTWLRFFGYYRFMIEHSDFSVVVKNRARPPKPWRWEIYRAGRTSPIEHSETYFETATEATRAGKAALSLLLSEYQP
jgi:hypothetical protein